MRVTEMEIDALLAFFFSTAVQCVPFPFHSLSLPLSSMQDTLQQTFVVLLVLRPFLFKTSSLTPQ
jgi:hypothetical protein